MSPTLGPIHARNLDELIQWILLCLNQTACSRNHVHGTNTAIEIQANNIYADSECHTRNGQYTD